MAIETGFITTQNGTTAPTDIGSIFSTGTTAPIYLQGRLRYYVDKTYNSTPFESIIYLQTTPPTITIVQNSDNFTLTVPQTGLYLITCNLIEAYDLNTSSYITYFFNAFIPDVGQTYNLSYCSSLNTSGSVIIPVTASNTAKTITLTCRAQSITSSTALATISYQISYLSAL